MLRNTLRRNKGITLIALVVTIIVLLILAGISIAMLTGQNGILNRAAEAKEKTRVAQEDESQKLKGYEDIMAQYTGNLPSREETKPYFPKDTNTDGTTYSVDYQNMLKSVYTNGGFWLGRYEAGIEGDTPRTSYTEISASDKAVVKQNKIPYNYVKRDEAQTLAQKMDYGDCKGSLIFGIQWDLVLKYIETKNPAQKSNLLTNSTSIGNYYNSSFELKRGKFAQNGVLSDWKDYNSEEKPTLVTGSKKKEQGSYENGILLTTGATEATNLQNIYDIAGNVHEWTLEFYTTSLPCVYRGGSSGSSGSDSPVKYRYSFFTSSYNLSVGFRVGLWK